MERKLEVTHMGFHSQITGKLARGVADGKWEKFGADVVWEAAGMQSEMN